MYFPAEIRPLLTCIYRGVPSDKDLDTAQYALTSIRNDLRERRAEAARREGANVCISFHSFSLHSFWVNKRPTVPGTPESDLHFVVQTAVGLVVSLSWTLNDLHSPVTQEIQGLEALEYQMSRNLDTLRERYATAKFAGTFKGWVFNVMGKIFMVYCVIRVISVSFFLFILVLDSDQVTLVIL